MDDALTQRTMDYKLVRLINPVFEIYRSKKENASKEDFTQRFLKEMKKLSVKNLVVEGGKEAIKTGKKMREKFPTRNGHRQATQEMNEKGNKAIMFLFEEIFFSSSQALLMR